MALPFSGECWSISGGKSTFLTHELIGVESLIPGLEGCQDEINRTS